MEDKQRIFIQGNEDKKEEVQKVLAKLGGKTSFEFDFGNPLFIYFIGHDGVIRCVNINCEYAKIIMDNYNEIKLDEKWKPKEKEIYWYINLDGHIDNDIFDNSIFDNNMYNFGNCFKTKKEAEIAAEKIKKLLNSE